MAQRCVFGFQWQKTFSKNMVGVNSFSICPRPPPPVLTTRVMVGVGGGQQPSTAPYHSVAAKPLPVLSDPVKLEGFDLSSHTPPTWSRLFYLFHCEFKGFCSKFTNLHKKCPLEPHMHFSSVLSCPQEEFSVHTVKLWFTCLSFAAHCSSSTSSSVISAPLSWALTACHNIMT